MVHRHQLDGRDAQPKQMVDGRGRAETGVGAAQRRRHVRSQLGETLDVGFVDDRVRPRHPARPRGGRLRGRHHHRPGYEAGRIGVVAAVRLTGDVPEHLGPPSHRSRDGAGVGVQQQFRRVAPQPGRGIPRAGHPEPVVVPGSHAGHMSAPGTRVVPLEGHPRLTTAAIAAAAVAAVIARVVE